MIHARKDYDRIQDPDGKIPIDEPVFLIRGQDPVGADAVMKWAELHIQHATSHHMDTSQLQALMKAVRIHAVKMERWAEGAGHGPADVPVDQLRLF